MNDNEFSVDRVDLLHQIASTTSVSNDKEKKRGGKNLNQQHGQKESETPQDEQADTLTAPPEKHAIDFQA
jgi:hypothetical protein